MDGGKKRPPAAVAIAFRLGPFGLAGSGLQKAFVGVGAGQRLLTPGTGAVGGGAFGLGRGLPRQCVGQPLLAEDLADGEEEVFALGQSGSPGRTVGALELVDEVFGDPFDIRTDFFYQRGVLLGSHHPWLLAELGSKE